MPRFWINRERQYQEELARHAEQERLSNEVEVVSSAPQSASPIARRRSIVTYIWLRVTCDTSTATRLMCSPKSSSATV